MRRSKMCGRYTLSDDCQKIFTQLKIKHNLESSPSYNIYPGQTVTFIKTVDHNQKDIGKAHWGIIPYWMKEEDIKSQWINARLGTVDEKLLFKESFKQRRCLILADGFYEWAPTTTKTKIKQPYYFHLPHREPFAFGSIWSQWKSKEGKIMDSCAILTMPANDKVKSIHNRMPLILKPEYYEEWLLPKPTPRKGWEREERNLNKLLQHYPVSTYVNNPVNEFEKCIEPIDKKI